jgi:hypothetical protein
MIYAQLVRMLHKAEVQLKDLFPADFEEEIYADFPPSTQAAGWGASFQDYMDNLYERDIIDSYVNALSVRMQGANTDAGLASCFLAIQ